MIHGGPEIKVNVNKGSCGIVEVVEVLCHRDLHALHPGTLQVATSEVRGKLFCIVVCNTAVNDILNSAVLIGVTSIVQYFVSRIKLKRKLLFSTRCSFE